VGDWKLGWNHGERFVNTGAQDGLSFRRRIAHPLLLTLYDYWLARRGDQIAMLRADLDPIEIPHLLPNLILSDVGDGGRAIRYRVVGTEIVTAHGSDYTGKTIEELTTGSTVAFTQTLYSIIVSQGMPVYSEGNFRWAGKEHRWTKRLHLPLSHDGKIIDMVLAGQVFEERAPEGDEVFQPATPAELEFDLTEQRRR
jgi:hypothetical protein